MMVVADTPMESTRRAPLLQRWAHTPAEQLPEAHALPQAPQWLELVARLTSQPSAGLPLQSAKPALQLPTRHAPATQAATALAGAQTVPQAPQLLTVVWVFTSQPSAAERLQSAKPEAQT